MSEEQRTIEIKYTFDQEKGLKIISSEPRELADTHCSACGSLPYRPWDAPHLLRCGNWNCEHHQIQNCKPAKEWNLFHS